MITEILFKNPNNKGEDVVVAKPFKLKAVARCYLCGVELKAEEKEHKSVFKYYNSDGNVLGTVETYVCFDCIKKFTERKENNA